MTSLTCYWFLVEIIYLEIIVTAEIIIETQPLKGILISKIKK